jgi:hypothetical protein
MRVLKTSFARNSGLIHMIFFTALLKLFLKTPHHKKSATPAPRPLAPEQTVVQAATMVGIVGRLAEGALQE